MAGKQVKVAVVAETRKFSRAFKGLARAAGLDKLVSGVKRIGGALLTAGKYAVAAGAAAAGAAVKVGADLEQSMGAIDSVFKDSAGTMHAYADAAAKSAGLSKNSYNELATLLGSQLKNAYRGTGRSIQEIGKQTNDLIGLGADLSSMFGGTTKDAVEALSSALKGERDPIERYGVTLKQATIDAKAAELGFKKVAGGFDAEAQAAATLALILEQTGDAHGNFAKESDTFAHQVQVGRAQIESFAQKLGMKLLPRLTELGQSFNAWLGPALDSFGNYLTGTVIPAVERAADVFARDWLPRIKDAAIWIKGNVVPALVTFGAALFNTAIWIKDNAAWIGQLAAIIAGAVAGWKAYQQALIIIKTAQTAVTAAQALMNAVMMANPIGLLITVVAALAAGFVYLVATNEGFRTKLVEAWTTVRDFVVGAVTTVGTWISNLIRWVAEIPGKVSDALSSFVATVKSSFNAAWKAALLVVTTTAANIVGFVSSIPGRIGAALASLASSLRSRMSSAWDSAYNAVTSAASNIFSFVSSIPGRIVSALGNLGSLLLAPARNLIDGFVGGIRRGFNRVKETLSNLTSYLPSWKGPASRDKTILRDAGRLVIDGFITGLESRYGHVRRSLTELTRDVANTKFDDLTAPGIRLAPALANGPHDARASMATPAPISINVYALDPTPEVGRRVATAIAQYQALGGRRG